MKLKKKYRLWIIRLLFFGVIPIIILIILYCTDNLGIVYNKIEREVSKWGILTIISYIIFFLFDIIKGWFSSYISDSVFPGDIQDLKDSSNKILKNQKEQELKLNDVLDSINFDPKIIQKYLKQLNKIKSFNQQTLKVEELYLENKISLKEKEVLIITLEHHQSTLSELKSELETVKNTSNNAFNYAWLFRSDHASHFGLMGAT